MFPYLIALCLPITLATGLPWHALPDGGGPDGRLEAALLVRDLRTARAAWERQRHVIAEVAPGEALLSLAPGLLADPFKAPLAMLAPQGGAVPAVVALISADDIFWRGERRAGRPALFSAFAPQAAAGMAARCRRRHICLATRADALGRAGRPRWLAAAERRRAIG